MVSRALNYREYASQNKQIIYSRLLTLVEAGNENYLTFFSVSELEFIKVQLTHLIPESGFNSEDEYYIYADFVNSIDEALDR